MKGKVLCTRHLYEEIPANDKMSRYSLHKNKFLCMCMNIHAYKYVYVFKIHTELCRHIYSYMEGKLGVLSRILHVIRSWMHAYPASKAIAQVKQCRTDGLLFQMLSFRIMQSVAGGSHRVSAECPCLCRCREGPQCLCSQPSAQLICLGEIRNGPWSSWWDVPCHAREGWHSPGPRQKGPRRAKCTMGRVRQILEEISNSL